MTDKNQNKLHLMLWVAQGLLAAAFGLSGLVKVVMPIEELAASGMSYVHFFGEAMVRFIGISEMLGALGLLLPAALRIKPILTPIAALGIATIMVSATIYHLAQGESILITVALFALAALVAWGRFKKAPIRSK